MVTIYNFARGLRGVRVFWLCEEMGIDYRVETVAFPYDASYRARNPAGGVPFLEDGAVAISESVAMLLYLAETYGPTPLLPGKGDPAFARVLQMTVYSEATIGGALNALMAAAFAAPEADKRNWSVRGAEGRVENALNFTAGVLGDAPYLAGDQMTIADIAIVTAMGMWIGALGKEVPANLKIYRDRLMERPAYQRAASRQAARQT